MIAINLGIPGDRTTDCGTGNGGQSFTMTAAEMAADHATKDGAKDHRYR